jgi:hypothetical protein
VIVVTWLHVEHAIQAKLAQMRHKLEGVDPTDVAAVAATQAAIRVYLDLLRLPADLVAFAPKEDPRV